MGKFEAIQERCKCGVFVSINEHRDYYESVTDWLNRHTDEEDRADIAPDVLAKMIETDTVVYLHFYPSTPIGFYVVFHYDWDKALDEALDCLDIEWREE